MPVIFRRDVTNPSQKQRQNSKIPHFRVFIFISMLPTPYQHPLPTRTHYIARRYYLYLLPITLLPCPPSPTCHPKILPLPISPNILSTTPHQPKTWPQRYNLTPFLPLYPHPGHTTNSTYFLSHPPDKLRQGVASTYSLSHFFPPYFPLIHTEIVQHQNNIQYSHWRREAGRESYRGVVS